MDKKPFVHKEGAGTLFQNDYKTAANHPDYKGTAMVNGTIMDVALWEKDGRFSVSIKKKEPRANDQQRTEGFKQMRQATKPAEKVDTSYIDNAGDEPPF